MEKTEQQQKQHQRYMNRREHKIAYATEWTKTHPEKRAIHCKRYMRKIKDRVNKYNVNVNRAKAINNPSFRVKGSIMYFHTMFLRGDRPHFATMVGLSLDEYKAHVESLWEPYMTWENYGKQWQIRRIKNWKDIDLTTQEGKIEFCNYKNIRLVGINQND